MKSPKTTYKFGLYGRCPSCKEITRETCEGCGAAESFTDSSKPGVVICTECGLEHSIRCTKPGCGNEIKVLRTPKNPDEKARIDEYIYRKKNKDLDKRVYTIKEKPKVKVVKEVSVPKDEFEKEEKKKDSVISLDSEIDLEISDKTKESVHDQPENISSGIEKESEAPKKVSTEDEEDSVKEEFEKNTENEAESKKEPTVEEKQELDKIKNFWKTKELTEQQEKKEEERRIVNQFYDEQDDDVLDKKINFENIYNETAYFDCRVCGTEEQKISCEKCGQSNQFSLNYDALSCRCGNNIKVRTCKCGAKHGHSDFYLISDGIKWQYSKSKSYYNYRKGRMLVFSTCPICGVFSVEKCKVCGSKVNFGIPNKNNEVYCKNCGTINQFLCENRNCNDAVKSLKNPSSIEQKLEWLNDVMNFKSKVKQGKVKYSEPGNVKKDKAKTSSSYEISIGGDSTPDFSNSFIEEFDNKTKEIITSSFIDEVENEVNQRKNLQNELRNHNKTQSGEQRSSFASPAGARPEVAPGIKLGDGDEDEENTEIAFDDSGKGLTFYIILVLSVIVIAAGIWWGITFLTSENSADPALETASTEKVQKTDVVSSKADAINKNIDTAEDAVDKMNDSQNKTMDAIDELE
ncbi:MAG: hypothetical protein R6V47_07340 [Candidatus Delongbacteria bacterium]